MKTQPTFTETVIGGLIAFVTLTIHMLCAHVAKPVVLFSGRMLWKGVKKGGQASWAKLTKLTKRKAKPVPAEMPTPDIFKGMPNLAPAKEMRF